MATGRNFFYQRVTVPAGTVFTDAPQLTLPFQASRIIIARGEEKTSLAFSFLAPNVDGELLCDDGPITFDGLNEGRLWFRATAQTTVRVWAWRG